MTDFTERLRAAVELLESIANNRELLAEASAEDRKRLLRAAGDVFQPDNVSRRRLAKAKRRQDKAEKTKREENALSDTGIRKLRRERVFNTPNVFPPPQFEQHDVDNPEFREAIEPLALLCMQAELHGDSSFL